ncbi:MAG: adenine phosphoribosyltransferase [Planctomycetota bacterium]
MAEETGTNSIQLEDFIRDVQDFPKPGIIFKDITPLLASSQALNECIDRFAAEYNDKQIDVIAAAEARGFLFAVPLAMRLGIGMVPIRKPGKLPYEKHSYSYELEYGSDTLEMHIDAVKSGDRVLVIDDLLATGGTVQACCEMIEQCGASVVGCGFLIHLAFLDGAKKLEKYPVFSLINCD